MKKILSVLIVMFMSISISAFAGTRTGKAVNSEQLSVNSEQLTVNNDVAVPKNIIVKQSITFMDGKTIVVFYKKTGNDCKVYSNENLNKYGVSDLMRIKSTNFERTDHVEGKCYASKTVGALVAMARKTLK